MLTTLNCDGKHRSLMAQMVKNLPAVQETWVWALGPEDPLEKGMATHCSILAWRIPWTEKPGGLQSMGSQWVRHEWATITPHVSLLWGTFSSSPSNFAFKPLILCAEKTLIHFVFWFLKIFVAYVPSTIPSSCDKYLIILEMEALAHLETH